MKYCTFMLQVYKKDDLLKAVLEQLKENTQLNKNTKKSLFLLNRKRPRPL